MLENSQKNFTFVQFARCLNHALELNKNPLKNKQALYEKVNPLKNRQTVYKRCSWGVISLSKGALNNWLPCVHLWYYNLFTQASKVTFFTADCFEWISLDFISRPKTRMFLAQNFLLHVDRVTSTFYCVAFHFWFKNKIFSQ